MQYKTANFNSSAITKNLIKYLTAENNTQCTANRQNLGNMDVTSHKSSKIAL